MEEHFKYTDNQFITAFENKKLSADQFTHTAHIRLAYCYIKKYGLKDAIEKLQDSILEFVAALGLKEKYHTTLTVASTYAVYHFMNRSDSREFESLISTYPKLVTDFKSLIQSHYSPELLFSRAARQTFIQPDISPFH